MGHCCHSACCNTLMTPDHGSTKRDRQLTSFQNEATSPQIQEPETNLITEEAAYDNIDALVVARRGDKELITDQLFRQQLEKEFLNALKDVKFNIYADALKKKKITEIMSLNVKKTLTLDLATYFKYLVPIYSEADTKCIANMKTLNDMNKQCLLCYFYLKKVKKQLRLQRLADLESIEIRLELAAIQEKKKGIEMLKLYNIKSKINLYSCVQVTEFGQVVLVKPVVSKDNQQRPRPMSNKRDDAIILSESSAKELDAYGKLWAKQVKGRDAAMPNLNELMEGIQGWLVQQYEAKIKDITSQERAVMTQRVKSVLKRIFAAVQIGNWDQGFTINQKDEDLGFKNPYSKISCLIGYLYSMELGTPQLYAEINRVTRQQDQSQLKYLGPFIKAFSKITRNAEIGRQHEDKIKTGELHQGVPENLAGSFLLWKGTPMDDDWVIPFVKNVGKDFMRLPSNVSFYRNPVVALDHALINEKQDHSPVLFVIAWQNYQSPSGMMFRSEALTPYPSEREFILMEGCNLWVLAVEPVFKIENTHKAMSRFNRKSLTIIHLYHY